MPILLPASILIALLITISSSLGQDAIPEIPRRIPPPGLDLPAERRAELEKAIADWIDPLWEISDQPYSADVEVLVKAVDFALRHGEFYKKGDTELADRYLELAQERYQQLAEEEIRPWTEQRGLVIRGYRSSIDDSAQPYGLEIPADLDLAQPVPLVVWLHGRGDKVTDLHFLERCRTQHQSYKGKIAEQSQAIIVHPFGRQCIGWKHAGELDVLDVIAAVQRDYPIDTQRIVLAGFSMGGAGAWHIGGHYRDRFCLVQPGAGFADVARYQRLQPDKFPPQIEQTLWGLYDVPPYRRNFLNGPLVAYSGEKDKQKDAADYMAEQLAEIGFEMPHIIGAEMGHSFDDASVEKLWQAIEDSWQGNANHPMPSEIHLQTRTLRYPSHHWLRLTGLGEHWLDSRADAKWDRETKTISLSTENITSLEITAQDDETDLGEYSVTIDGTTLQAESPGFAISSLALKKDATSGAWTWGEPSGLRKRPGLQGPMDDAMMNRFVVVPPDGEIADATLSRWVSFELDHFRSRWQALMRGSFFEEKAYNLDSRDIDTSNLILWGDPQSNRMIAEIIDQLPIEWGSESFTFRGETYSTATHVPAFIFPNPTNPNRYVLINSGLTFREDHDRTNSLQNPKLGDWAIIGLKTLPNGSAPGEIVATGFFDEQWR